MVNLDEKISESDKLMVKTEMAQWRLQGIAFLEGLADGLGLKTTTVEREQVDPFALNSQKSVLSEAFKPLTKELDTYMAGSMVLWSKSKFLFIAQPKLNFSHILI